MPRSSRHKSHKQSKHSSKEAKEYSDSEVEDVKIKVSGSGSISDRVLKDSGHLISGEKRKLSSQVKEGKDSSAHRNGEVVEEYVSSKRRKEKAADKSNGGDRWNGGERRGEGAENEKKGESLKNDGEKGSKLREAKGDMKARSSSKRLESGGIDMKEDNGALLEEKEYIKSGGRSEKRKSDKEKDGKDFKELREKERGSEKEKKGLETRRSNEVNVDGAVLRKQEMQSDDFGEDGHVKRSKNNTERSSKDEMRIAEIEEKRVRKKKESIVDLDKYQDDIRDGEVRHLLSRSERVKEGRSFVEKNKDGNHGDKYYEDVDRDVKYHDDLDRDNKHRDDKYKDDGDRDDRHRDDKYRDNGDKDGRRREDKHREESGRDAKRRDDKHRGESERDGRRRDDKYREDGERDNRRKDEKQKEDVEKESRHNDNRNYDEADRDGRHKVMRFKEDTDRDIRHKEDKYREDYEKENRHRDKVGDDVDREKRFREGKYRDRLSKDRSGDKSDSKHARDENHASVFHSRKSSLYDDGDDRLSRYRDDHAEKHSSGPGRGDLAIEQGRSTSKMADMDLSATHYRRQSSPSSGSHVMNNQYRHAKQDEPKYKDYGVTPNRELEKKHLQRDDQNSGELAAERRIRPDTLASPMPLMDKSPSSLMSERRTSRIDVRRDLDGDDSGSRYGGSRDGKDFSGREARGSRDVAMEMFPRDEFSQVGGDIGSVSSPFARNGHISNSAKSLLPLPPFRSGVDSSLPFGMSDDDSRGNSSNHHRRLGDTSMGRMQGNSWRGAPNWPSPVANGFMPFQHGPPPVGFHPVMQQFPAPPLYGVRPSMDLNHNGLPYPISDADRFSGHVRPMGWRNSVDDSCPPPLHGWEANNAAFNEDSQLYGRPDWDNSRNLPGVRTNSVSTELGTSEKKNILMQGEADQYIAGQFSQNVKNQHGFQADSSEAGPPGVFVERETSEPSLKFKEIPASEKDDGHLWHAYLSKLDISADLTGPELYVQCTNLHDVDQSLLFDGDEPKILYLEEVIDGKTASNKVQSTFLFTATDDSVFQKAMILYNKHKEKFKIMKSSSLSPYGMENTGSLRNISGEENMSRKKVSVEEKEVVGGEQDHIDLPNMSTVEPDASQNRVTDDMVYKSEGSAIATSNTSMEVQVSSDIEARDMNESVIEEELGVETAASNGVENEMSMSKSTLTSDMGMSIIEGEKGMDVLLVSDVPEACETESIESGSVNLSRIHHSPESTH